MKKFAPIVAVAVLGMMFASCKKNYTCTCTQNGVTTKYEYKKVKKDDAEAACAASNTLFALGGGSCSL